MVDDGPGVPISGLDEAAGEIETPLLRDITYFQPATAKNIEPVSFVAGFAMVLVTSYLAGFQEEAKKSAKKLGRENFRWLKSLIAGYFSSAPQQHSKRKPSTEEQDAAQLAKDAVDTAATLDQETYQQVLAETEKQLCAELMKSNPAMPKSQVEKLAHRIRAATEKHVLAKRRPRK
jgi:hypothetical protein